MLCLMLAVFIGSTTLEYDSSQRDQSSVNEAEKGWLVYVGWLWANTWIY